MVAGGQGPYVEEPGALPCLRPTEVLEDLEELMAVVLASNILLPSSGRELTFLLNFSEADTLYNLFTGLKPPKLHNPAQYDDQAGTACKGAPECF